MGFHVVFPSSELQDVVIWQYWFHHAAPFPLKHTLLFLWGLFIAHVCTGYYFFILLNWIPTYFTEVYPGHKGWVFNVAPWLVSIPSSVFSCYLSGQLVKAGCTPGKARKIVFSFCISGMVPSLLLVSFTTSFNKALLLMVIAVSSHAAVNGAIKVNIQDIAPNHAGVVFGVCYISADFYIKIKLKLCFCVSNFVFQSLCAFGMVSSLVLVSFTSNYNTALLLMVIAAGSQAFANGALPVNIQDIAPKHVGAVFGVLNTVGALQGFIGSYAAGYILYLSESWPTVFCSTAAIAFFGWTMFMCFASGKPIL